MGLVLTRRSSGSMGDFFSSTERRGASGSESSEIEIAMAVVLGDSIMVRVATTET